MIRWLQACTDRDTIYRFGRDVDELWQYESGVVSAARTRYTRSPAEFQAALQAEATARYGDSYQEVRSRVAQGVLEAERIARRNGVPVDGTSLPAPLFGGYAIPISVFEAIIQDNSHAGIAPQLIVDKLNQVRGATEARVCREFWRMLSPLTWVESVLGFFLGLPFRVLHAAGFDMDKVEEHLVGRVFKLAELGAILYVLGKLSLKTEILQAAVQALRP